MAEYINSTYSLAISYVPLLNQIPHADILGALFLCLIFIGYSNASGVLPFVASARVVMYREKAANMYCTEAFALTSVSHE